jgi:3',5'-cyclic AMP phosphodiesterase CpdA
MIRPLVRRLLILSAIIALLSPTGSAVQQPAAPAADKATPASAAPESFRFAVVGDTGTGKADQLAVARQMLAEHDRRPYELVLMLGDNIYSSKFRIEETFEIPYRELLKRGVRFYATLGNHDQVTAEQQINYSNFNMGGRRWYSFAPAGGLVEFFTIDSTPIHSGQHLEQLQWLDEALARSKARWKIAFFHHPPYSPGSRHKDNPVMISRVVPILKKHGVRVVLTGHEHFFVKLKTLGGIDYLISGSGGKIHRSAIDTSYSHYEAGNDQLHHFLTVTLTPDSFDVSAVGATGDVLYRGAIPLAVTTAAAAGR